jgi:hypothetical protein
LIIDVVRRVREHQIRGVNSHQSLDIGRRRSVSAQHAMITEDPEIAWNRDRRLRDLRDRVFVGQSLGRILGGEKARQLFIVKANEVEVVFVVLQHG